MKKVHGFDTSEALTSGHGCRPISLGADEMPQHDPHEDDSQNEQTLAKLNDEMEKKPQW